MSKKDVMKPNSSSSGIVGTGAKKSTQLSMALGKKRHSQRHNPLSINVRCDMFTISQYKQKNKTHIEKSSEKTLCGRDVDISSARDLVESDDHERLMNLPLDAMVFRSFICKSCVRAYRAAHLTNQ